jgi:hypothetical protein
VEALHDVTPEPDKLVAAGVGFGNSVDTAGCGPVKNFGNNSKELKGVPRSAPRKLVPIALVSLSNDGWPAGGCGVLRLTGSCALARHLRRRPLQGWAEGPGAARPDRKRFDR